MLNRGQHLRRRQAKPHDRKLCERRYRVCVTWPLQTTLRSLGSLLPSTQKQLMSTDAAASSFDRRRRPVALTVTHSHDTVPCSPFTAMLVYSFRCPRWLTSGPHTPSLYGHLRESLQIRTTWHIRRTYYLLYVRSSGPRSKFFLGPSWGFFLDVLF